tara:strand:+ start:987 stop:1556 length:570 start_codon:yes stop_codon:yes gene_type:complete
MIAESMAAFALVKGTIDAVKAAVDTAQDVQGISSGLDALFHHRDAAARELKKKAKTAKPKSKLHKFFSKKTGEDEEDELSVGAVAAMVLEQKKIDRDILNLGIRIDNKFGEGTWDEIIQTRDNLLEERKAKRKKAKEAAAAQALEDEAFYDKIIRCIIEAGKLIGVLAAAVIAGAIIWMNRAGANSSWS